MRNLKIIQLFRTFSEDEFKEFIKFSGNKYYVKDRNYTDILQQLKKYLYGFENLERVPAEIFYNDLFKGKTLSNQTRRNRLNELSKICERFIIEKEIGEDNDLRSLLLIQGLNKRKLNNLFIAEYKKITSVLNNKSEKSHIISDILNLKVVFAKENRQFEEMFSDFNKYFEYLFIYFLEILFNYAKEYQIEKMYGVNPSVRIFEVIESSLNFEKLIEFLEEQNNSSYIRLIMNYYQYKSLTNLNNIFWFKKFQKLFDNNINGFSNDEKNAFMTHMISYYFYKINEGKTEYLKDVFKLYKLKLKLGLYSELKEIRYPSNAFRDYIVVGIRLKQYSWVENFIKKYSGVLPDEIKEEETNMAYARLFFGKKEFNKSLEMSGRIKSNNPLYYLDASRNKLRILYETLKFEEAFPEIDRMKHYIDNNIKKIAMSVRNYSKDFIDYYSKLLKFRLNADEIEIGYFLKNAASSDTLISKDWFIRKIKELK